VNSWINRSVKLNDTWGPGAKHSLTNPLNVLPEFALRPRNLRDSKGNAQAAHFSLDFSSGYLSDGWRDITFTPMGNIPVKDISGLPPWDASQRDTYRKAIENAKSLADSRTERLEAIVPHLENDKVAYNTIRLFYVTNALKDGSMKDLVVVRVVHFSGVPGTVQARQDGNGQGPPK
jgi:hypothetical protein